METMSPASAFSIPHEQQHNYEEYIMEQSLLFSDSLKDLKNLRSQLYSAAEYFEVSYTKDDQKEVVVNTLKDYTISALVNTVDHLGSVTYKVTDLLDEKVDEVSGTELRVSCIEQRLKTCQECIDHEGLSQQSLVMTTPKYHKRYILPDKHAPPCSFLSVDETMLSSEPMTSKYQDTIRDNVHYPSHLINGVQTTTRRTQPDTIRKCRSRSPSPQPSSHPGPFSFTEKTGKHKHSEKRSASPLRSMFPLLRSASPSSRPSTPHSSRPTTPTPSRPRTPTPARPRTPTPSRPATPNSFNTRPRYRHNTQKSSSSHLHAEQDNPKDIEQYPSKSKRLFKALLSRRKVKQDDTLYTYLDEY